MSHEALDVGHGKVPVIGDIKDQAYFARYHDAAEYGVLACDCYGNGYGAGRG